MMDTKLAQFAINGNSCNTHDRTPVVLAAFGFNTAGVSPADPTRVHQLSRQTR